MAANRHITGTAHQGGNFTAGKIPTTTPDFSVFFFFFDFFFFSNAHGLLQVWGHLSSFSSQLVVFLRCGEVHFPILRYGAVRIVFFSRNLRCGTVRFCSRQNRTVRCGSVKPHRTAPHRKKKTHRRARPNSYFRQGLRLISPPIWAY